MPQNIEFEDNELKLIFKLCEQTTISGYDTAKALVNVMEKIHNHFDNSIPAGQTSLPILNKED